MVGRSQLADVAGVVVRPAQEADIAEVVEIERASFADPWSASSFMTSLEPERMRFLVAEDSAGESAVLGYVIALIVGDEGEIADLAVSPLARRRGVGAMLLDRIFRDLVGGGVRSLFLEVRESNTAARALYATRSFRTVGRRRGYYRHPPEDALILRRDFEPT